MAFSSQASPSSPPLPSVFHIDVGTGQDRVIPDPTRSTPNQSIDQQQLNDDNVLNELASEIHNRKCATIMPLFLIIIWGFGFSMGESLVGPLNYDRRSLLVGCACLLIAFEWIMFESQLTHIPVKSKDMASFDLKWERIIEVGSILYGVLICLGLMVYLGLDPQVWYFALAMFTCIMNCALDDLERIVIIAHNSNRLRLNSEPNRTTHTI